MPTTSATSHTRNCLLVMVTIKELKWLNIIFTTDKTLLDFSMGKCPGIIATVTVLLVSHGSTVAPIFSMPTQAGSGQGTSSTCWIRTSLQLPVKILEASPWLPSPCSWCFPKCPLALHHHSQQSTLAHTAVIGSCQTLSKLHSESLLRSSVNHITWNFQEN